MNLVKQGSIMKKINILATASLLLTAAIWGLSYSAQSEAMKTMPPAPGKGSFSSFPAPITV